MKEFLGMIGLCCIVVVAISIYTCVKIQRTVRQEKLIDYNVLFCKLLFFTQNCIKASFVFAKCKSVSLKKMIDNLLKKESPKRSFQLLFLA